MLQNFRAIMKYNPAEAYALAIGHLADRLRGGGPFVQAWPRHERVLTRAERLELQQLLAQRGFDVGEPDGRLGRQDPQRAARSSSRASARCPTASPPRRCWSGCAAGKTVWGWAGASAEASGHLQVDIFGRITKWLSWWPASLRREPATTA